MFDIAHPAGLVAGGVHPNPVGIVDVVTLTTHKTLRGPRGGAILCNQGLAKAIDSAVFPGLQGGPLEHVIVAKAVRSSERPRCRRSGTMRRGWWPTPVPLPSPLSPRASGWCRGGPTTTCSSSTCGLSTPSSRAKRAKRSSTGAGITLNRNTIPDDPRSPFVTSGLRLGTAAQTTAGMGPVEMAQIAGLIGRALRQRGDEAALRAVRGEVLELCGGFPPYPELVRGASRHSPTGGR